MDPFDIAAISVVSGLSILGSVYATWVIPRKGRIFSLIIALFIVATAQIITQYFRRRSNPSETDWWIAHTIIGVCYCFLFYCTNWLYVLRLFTLGHLVTYERLTRYTPPVIGILAAANYAVYTAHMTASITYTAYTAASCTLLAIALLLEIYLTTVLIRKVAFVFTDNPTIVHPSIVTKTKIYLVAIVALEITIFVLRVFVVDPRSPEAFLRVFGFIVRVLVIVDFFRDLLRCLVRRGTPLYSL